MKQLISLFGSILVAIAALSALLGPSQALTVAYGAVALMALLISATFLWLWYRRATPLALGMSLSWAGSGLTLGWWYLLHVAGVAAQFHSHPVLFGALSLLISGAVLHFLVIQGTFGFRGLNFTVPVAFAFTVSLGVLLLV